MSRRSGRYWPARDATVDAQQWQATLNHIHADRQRSIDLPHDDKTDLLATISHGAGQTILREAVLIADYNAYHTDEIIRLRRLLHAWK